MSQAIIETIDLSKSYPIRRRQTGWLTTLKARFVDPPEQHLALDRLSLAIQAGEIVGLIGANGAGKSTTVKLLAGILYPSEGTVRVFGKDPTQERRRNAQRFGIVMGQRSQLWWDLPAYDSLELYRRMYGVSRRAFADMLEQFTTLLDLSAFLNTPVRNLSLGQRMRCELAAALLHRPTVLFLDEPTIGIDVLTKGKILDFIRQINADWQATVLLTTHNLADMERVAQRILILDHGKLIYNGSVDKLRQIETKRQINVEFRQPVAHVAVPGTEVEEREPLKYTFTFEAGTTNVADVITHLVLTYPIADIAIVQPHIDDLVTKIYAQGAAIFAPSKHESMLLEEHP